MSSEGRVGPSVRVWVAQQDGKVRSRTLTDTPETELNKDVFFPSCETSDLKII